MILRHKVAIRLKFNQKLPLLHLRGFISFVAITLSEKNLKENISGKWLIIEWNWRRWWEFDWCLTSHVSSSLRKLNPIKRYWSVLVMAVELWQRQVQTALQSLGLLQEVVKQKQNNFQSNLLYTKSRSLKFKSKPQTNLIQRSHSIIF